MEEEEEEEEEDTADSQTPSLLPPPSLSLPPSQREVGEREMEKQQAG